MGVGGVGRGAGGGGGGEREREFTLRASDLTCSST